MAPSGSSKKIANSLVAMSSAAIMAVYAAGYAKTRAAATLLDEADQASNGRRPAMPAPATAGETRAAEPIEPPAEPPVPTTALSPAIAVAPPPEAIPAEIPIVATKPEAIAGTAAPAKSAPVVKSPKPAPVAAPVAVPETPPVAEASAALTAVPASTPLPSDPEPAPALKMPKELYKDGTYLGWGTSRHGDIQASITVEDGRFVKASIAQCWTRYSCSWVAHLPPQVVARQSPDVDYVSGATQSANAFYWAIVDALSKAK